jgi:chromosome segregation ATPase
MEEEEDEDEHGLKTNKVEEKRAKFVEAFTKQLDCLRHAKEVYVSAEKRMQAEKEKVTIVNEAFLSACLQHDKLRSKLEELNDMREQLTTSISAAVQKNTMLSNDLQHATKRKKKAAQNLASFSSSAEAMEAELVQAEQRNADLLRSIELAKSSESRLQAELEELGFRGQVLETSVHRRRTSFEAFVVQANAFENAINVEMQKEIQERETNVTHYRVKREKEIRTFEERLTSLYAEWEKENFAFAMLISDAQFWRKVLASSSVDSTAKKHKIPASRKRA